jgi:uncharacterized protein (TIGR03437 family)
LLLVCNSGDTFLTLIDPNTLSTVDTIPVTQRSSQIETPYSIAAVSGNGALLSTNRGFQLVDIVAKKTEPVTNPGFAASNARLVSSGDNAFGQGGSFAFHYTSGVGTGSWGVRVVSGSAVLAAGPSGSRFMVGATQFNNQLVQTGQIFPASANGQPPPIGGVAFAHDGNRIFVGINQSPAEVRILRQEGLRQISSFQVPERITGAMLTSPGDEFLFAISESGITVMDLDDLQAMPSMAVSSRSLYFAASLCDVAPVTRTVQINGSGEGSFSWTASTTVADVTLEPTSGTGPGSLQVTIDPVRYRSRGTAFLGTITVRSEESIGGDQSVLLLLNMHSPDQIGTLFPVEGFLSDLLVDEGRQRVYLVNTSRNQIEVFSTAQNAFLPAVEVGSMPKAIEFTSDRSQLLVTHLGRESIKVLNADSLSQLPEISIPHPSNPTAPRPGTLPFSIARAAAGAQIVAAAPAGGATSGTIYRVNPASGPFQERLTNFASLAGTSNSVNAITYLQASADGAYVIGAQRGGNVHLYNSATGNFIISRSLGTTIGGNVAASADGSWFHAGDRILSSVLVQQDAIPATVGVPNTVTGFAFAPLGDAGYRGIRPNVLSSGFPPAVGPRIEKVDASTREVVSDFAITEALTVNSSVPAFAIMRQLAVNDSETVLYGIADAGLLAMTLPNLESPARPQINSGGVVNGASFAAAPAPVAPGSIASIFGTSLSIGISNASSLPLPTELGGVCVTFDAVAAPIISTSPSQLNVQIPWELAGRSSASVVVSGDGLGSRPRAVSLASTAPGVFSFTSDGQGPGAILHADFSPVSIANPARIGETVLIYATGLGPTSPAVGTGLPAPSGGYQSATPSVQLGGVAAQVAFSGLAPGFVGLYQINIRIPSNVQIGTNVPLVVRMGTRESNQTSMAIVPASP